MEPYFQNWSRVGKWDWSGWWCRQQAGLLLFVILISSHADYWDSCLLPFQVECHVGYVPSGQRVVGLSKLSRVADIFAKRLQDPQRLAHQHCTALHHGIKPTGVSCSAVFASTFSKHWVGLSWHQHQSPRLGQEISYLRFRRFWGWEGRLIFGQTLWVNWNSEVVLIWKVSLQDTRLTNLGAHLSFPARWTYQIQLWQMQWLQFFSFGHTRYSKDDQLNKYWLLLFSYWKKDMSFFVRRAPNPKMARSKFIWSLSSLQEGSSLVMSQLPFCILFLSGKFC